jgi:Transposase.
LKRKEYKHHRKTAANVKAELNIQFEDPVSTKTVQQQLHKSTIHSTAGTATPLITENKSVRRKRWHGDHKI